MAQQIEQSAAMIDPKNPTRPAKVVKASVVASPISLRTRSTGLGGSGRTSAAGSTELTAAIKAGRFIVTADDFRPHVPGRAMDQPGTHRIDIVDFRKIELLDHRRDSHSDARAHCQWRQSTNHRKSAVPSPRRRWSPQQSHWHLSLPCIGDRKPLKPQAIITGHFFGASCSALLRAVGTETGAYAKNFHLRHGPDDHPKRDLHPVSLPHGAVRARLGDCC